MKQIIDIQEAIHKLKDEINEAYRYFDEWIERGSDYKEPSWLIEVCFLYLLAITEALGLEELRKMIYLEYSEVKNSKEGFTKAGQSPDGEPYSIVLARIRQFSYTLESFFPTEDRTKITKDLLQIIRDIHYVITDKELFRTIPGNEKDVHLRIEGILKCVFPDLKHKPTLTKQIRNFVPDTGIPSIETLIEYKFLSRREDIATIADEVLADTRGYTSKDWNRFLYVIYETNRIRPERDWNQFLRQSGVPENTTIVVLGGEPARRKRKKKWSPPKKINPTGNKSGLVLH
jgi:hypothetical protein